MTDKQDRRTHTKTIPLSTFADVRAPYASGKSKPWFFFDPKGRSLQEITAQQSFEFGCAIATLTQGIGVRPCLTEGKYALLVLASAVYAAIMHTYLCPEAIHYRSTYGGPDLNELNYKVLWAASEQNHETLDQKYLAALLRVSIPTERWAPPERPYQRSLFEDLWLMNEMADTLMHSRGNLRIRALQEGNNRFEKLPETAQQSVLVVASHIPEMLELVLEHLTQVRSW